jgi:protein gp37
MENTSISFCHHTMNFWTGCQQISPGCDHCYMFAGQRRYGKDPEAIRRTGEKNWKDPYSWHRKAVKEGERKRVFTCSWSDFFIQEADAWRPQAWRVIRETPALDWLILTKRPGRIRYCLPPDWGDGYPHVWLGVSVESQAYKWRIETVKKIPAVVRWLSVEPLLEDLGALDLSGIHWAIVGGESGKDFRPMPHEWVRPIRDQCLQHGVAFYFKQSAGKCPETGPALEEEDGSFTKWEQYPV